MRMTNNASVAEELTQDAFLQISRKLATFREGSALSTWMYRVVVNTVLMYLRKKQPQVFPHEPSYLETLPLKRSYSSSEDGGVVQRLVLMQAIRELPSRYRAILLLHEVGGYGHEEIAALLACSVASSKARLYKAKRKLRGFLTQMNNSAPREKTPGVAGLPVTTHALTHACPGC